MRAKRTMPWAGMTLIELLTVVAIIGILAAILLSAFRGASEQALAVRCKSNLKSLFEASVAYAHDHPEGRLPWATTHQYSRHYPYRVGPNKHRWRIHRGWVDWIVRNNGETNSQPASISHPPEFWHNHPYSTDFGRRTAGRIRWWDAATGDGRFYSDGTHSIVNGTLWLLTGMEMKVYMCPKFAHERIVGTTSPRGETIRFRPMRNYAMNERVQNHRITELSDASRTIMFAEMHTRREELVDGVRVAEKGLFNSVRGASTTASDSDDLSERRMHLDAFWDGSITVGAITNVNQYTWYEEDPADGARRQLTRNWPRESVGSYHGVLDASGRGGYGHAVFCDGHVGIVYASNTYISVTGQL